MKENDFYQQVQDGYRSINNQWMRIQFKLLFYCMVVSGVLEISMFFIIYKSGTLNCSINEYWFKYIIVPFLLNLLVVCAGYIVYKQKKMRVITKRYVLSLLCVTLAFILSLMHSGFITVLIASFFPVLMTVMYENKMLTSVIAISSAVTQTISGFSIFWDPNKVVDSSYKVNLIVLLTGTLFAWLTCVFMINFMKMKRKIILDNDVERYRLQRDINIDGLTGVGNKLALMARLDGNAANFKDIKYIAMLDLDHFKEINDTYGHIFGDDVLRCMGDALQNMQGWAEPYRYGGDEFCIVFSEKKLDDAIQEIKKAQAHLTRYITMPDGQMNIFFSVGIASYSSKKTITELLHHADTAMYKAKKSPPNGIAIYDDELTIQPD